MMKDELRDIFKVYASQIFPIEVDIRFWKIFINQSISHYQKNNPHNDWINDAGFTMYNLSINPEENWLYQSDISHTIWIKDLTDHGTRFFCWIMNLSLVRAYNSAELALFDTAQTLYFSELPSPSQGRSQLTKLANAIRADMALKQIACDGTNNRFLINYLSLQSSEFAEFVNLKMNTCWDITWKQFFDLFSTLRNVVVHQEMFLTIDTLNAIKSVAKQVFGHYFKVDQAGNSGLLLTPRDEHVFLDLLQKLTDFIANTMKFLVKENDLQFLGMKRA